MSMLPRAEFLATLARKRVISSALICDSMGRVLCVKPVYKKTWHLPGGAVEAGESPSDACARECQEELGITGSLGRLLAVGHLPPEAYDPHGAIAFVYEASIGDTPLSGLVLPVDELEGVAWLDSAQRGERLSSLARGLAAAGLEATKSGSVVELDR